MNGFMSIVKKELRAIVREKTIIIAIIIQLFVASFSSALLLGLLSIYDTDSASANAPIGLRIGFLGDSSGPLAGYLRARNLEVLPYGNLSDAETAFQTGSLDLLLVAPPDNGGVSELKLILPESEVLGSLIQIALHEPLKSYENYLRQERGIVVHFTDITGKPSTTFEFLYSVLLPLLMFFPAFVGGSLVIDSLSEEIETNTLETLRSAPLSLNTILGAKITAALGVVMAQCSLWLGLLTLNQVVIQNMGLVLVLAGLTAALNIVVCTSITLLFRDRERSQFLYALFILCVGSLSYVFDFAPVQLVTRLAIGDYYAGIGDVAKYALALVVVSFVFIRSTRRMAGE
jgi:ABC-2 type transport system permease protein